MAEKRIVDLTNMTPAMTRELNEIAKENRKKYTEFIDELSIRYQDEEFWWDTSVSSRNFGCKCFEEACILKLLLAMEQRGELDAIITDSEVMGELIRKNSRIAVTMKQQRQSLKYRLRNSRFVMREYNYRKLCARMRKHHEPEEMAKKIPKNREVILVNGYAIPSEISDGVFKDRYFPGLKENTTETILFLTQMTYYDEEEGKALWNMLRASADYLVSDAFVTKEDLKEVRRFIRWCEHFSVRDCIFDGVDLTASIANSIRKDAWSRNSMFGILTGNVICRLISDYGLNPKKVIDWYEGQPSSNGMFRRLRRRFPEVSTMAYVVSPCVRNNLGLYPSEIQVQKRIVAEQYGIQGKSWEKMIREFCEQIVCRLAPSFRHQDVFEEQNEERTRNGIVLVLPYYRESARQMLSVFFEALSEDDERIITIKNHPANDSLEIKDYGIKEEKYSGHIVAYENGPLLDVLQTKEVVIIAKSTSILEILLSGMPTIIYVPTGELGIDVVPDEADSYLHRAYDCEDMQKFLYPKKIFGLGIIERDLLREQAFVRTEQKTVKGMIESKVYEQ